MTLPEIDRYKLFADKHNMTKNEVLTIVNFDNNHPLHAELEEWVAHCNAEHKGETLTVESFKNLRKKVDEQETEIRELRSCMLQFHRAISSTLGGI